MVTRIQKNDMLATIGVVILLVGTASGSAEVMFGLSVIGIIVLSLLDRKQLGSGPFLVAFVAAVTAGIISVVLASRR